MAATDGSFWQRVSSASAIALPFLALTTALMIGVLYGIAHSVLPDPAVLIGLFGPAIFAIALVAAEKTASVKALLRQYVRVRAPLHVYLVALLTVPTLLLFTQQIALLMLPDLSWTRFATLSIPQMVFIPVISIGEELGWRGYLQPRMRRFFSLPTASVIVGITWALWHLPGYFFNTGVVDGVTFFWFGAWVVSGAVIMGWLYERCCSVFVAIVFHTSANVNFNMILVMPNTTGSPILFKMFAVLAAVSAAALLFAWSRGSGTQA
jgi:membrane protease YdiL (CAAX protease family)